MALSKWDEMYLNDEQKKSISNATKYGESTGDWDTAHSLAEQIRGQAGYSGGADGSAYDVLQPANPYDLSDELRKQYAANAEAELAGLKSAYDKNLAALDNTAKAIPATYNEARRTAAAQGDIAQRNFNEMAAASGLNSGAGGQAALALGAQTRGNLAALDREQAKAIADADLQRANLQADYEAAIAQAKANNSAALSDALYNEMVRVQNIEAAKSGGRGGSYYVYDTEPTPEPNPAYSEYGYLDRIVGSSGVLDLNSMSAMKNRIDTAKNNKVISAEEANALYNKLADKYEHDMTIRQDESALTAAVLAPGRGRGY